MAGNNEVGADVIGVLALAVFLILLGLLIGDASLGFFLGLIVLLLIVYAMFRVPARLTMMALMFFTFVLPNPAEGLPTEWEPPRYTLGGILLNHLNTVDRSFSLLSSVSLSGMDILFITLGLILLQRSASNSKIDKLGQVATPKPMIRLAQLSICITIFTWLSGLVRGGDFSMSLWQVNAVIYLPVVFLLFQASLRGPSDYSALGRVVLMAATYKCFLAMFVVYTIKIKMDPDTGSTSPPYGTSHNDSMLFACAFVMLIAPLIERAGKRAKWLAVIFLPILIAGTLANNRRLAWVQVGLVFLTVYFVTRETPLKRKIRRSLFVLAPVFALYVIAGWNSQYGKAFKVVRMIRSVVDAKTDASTEWRELENVNIIATFREHQLLGTGFGHPYKEVVVLPSVDYSLEKYIPHNSLLAVWCYTGFVGYAGLTLLWMAGVYFAMRAYYNATTAPLRVAALVSFGAVLVYLLQSWGDLGLASWTGVFMMGCALAMAGKLATASGQWSATSKRTQQAPGPSVRVS